jgi:subtilisin family serine protease
MSTIQPKFFSPTEMKNLRIAIDGGDATESAKATRKPSDGLQDVLILAPEQSDSRRLGGESLTKAFAGSGLKIQETVEDVGVAARASKQDIERLKEEGFQVIDNSRRQMQPSLPGFTSGLKGNPWDMPIIDPVKMTHSDSLQQQGATGKGVVIAVLDSGFDYPAYNDQLVAWKDVVNDSPTPHDGSGHGTHVVGDVLKTAPDAGIVAIKVMGDDGSGSPLDIIKGLKEVAKLKQQGVNIQAVNMSLGGAPDGLPDGFSPINMYVEKLNKLGITVVAAAGNSGPKEHTIGSPADSKSAIAIGAALDEKTVSDFSSRGPTDDGLQRPDLVAPGEFIVSWGVPYSEMYKTAQSVERLRDMSGAELKKFIEERPKIKEALGLPEDITSRPDAEVELEVKPKLPPVYLTDDGQVAAPGTSFASPITAGVVGALESVKDISPAETRELLTKTSDLMENFGTLDQGAGFINAEKALNKLKQG